MPKGDVPGEWYSPTQPFPTKPPAYARQAVTVDELIDFTPDMRAQALKNFQMYKTGPMFLPPAVSVAGGPLAALTIGTLNGGTNWPGAGYDPETHVVYAPASNAALAPIVEVDATAREELGGLPVPLVDGRTVTGPRDVPGGRLCGANVRSRRVRLQDTHDSCLPAPST